MNLNRFKDKICVVSLKDLEVKIGDFEDEIFENF